MIVSVNWSGGRRPKRKFTLSRQGRGALTQAAVGVSSTLLNQVDKEHEAYACGRYLKAGIEVRDMATGKNLTKAAMIRMSQPYKKADVTSGI
jgi:hypothetical protein